jgi:biotin carboxylase
VAKPKDGLGSRETFLARTAEELDEGLAGAWAAGAGAMVVEEYLADCPEVMAPDFASFVSVESVVGGGRLRHLAVMGKFPLAPPFRETGHFTPSQLRPDLVDAVLDTVTATVLGLGITVGGLHTEVKLTPDGPRIIEVNGRTGGAVPDVLTAAGGCSLVEAAMRVALGEVPDGTGLSPCGRVGYRINVQPPVSARRVVAVEGAEEVRHLSGVRSVTVLRPPGDAVDWRLGTDELVLAVIGSVGTLAELEVVRHDIAAHLTVTYG